MPPLVVQTAADLDGAACLDVAGGRILTLGQPLLDGLARRRADLLVRLERGDAVYGVTTGMGAASVVRLDADAQALQQQNLMQARSVGSAPWLGEVETRAVIAVRLRTLLNGDAGVSPDLCQRLVALLNDAGRGGAVPDDAVPGGAALPQLPFTRLGSAGEIVPLAHLGRALAPYRLGPKEGVALIEGVPVTTALALLVARQTRILLEPMVTAVAAELALVGASLDPYRDEVVRGDAVLLGVVRAIRERVGVEATASTLQAPLSFRVVGPALAHLLRSLDALDASVERALVGVTDSPAFIDDDFVGTAGFDGFDLAAHLDSLRVATIHVAEVATARVHRLLDDRITGLPRQLSGRPGLHAGMVTVHKRAVGVVHELVRTAAPASLGAIETSLGQEDVQSFSIEAATSAAAAVDGLRDVLACELLAITQARRLGGTAASDLLDAIDAAVAPGTDDRPFGRDVDAIVALLSP